MTVERWGLLQTVSEAMLAEEFYEDLLVQIARDRFEKERPDYEVLEVEPVQVARAQPPFDWTTYEDEDGVEHTYKTPPLARIVLKVAKR